MPSDPLERYPYAGFHFMVAFELFPQLPYDLKFQEVSGLKATVETEEFMEGGQNQYKYRLPTQISYSDLELKRGFLLGSGVVHWFKETLENFQFKPTSVVITLLNEDHLPVSAWHVVNAYPKEWSFSGFNAERSELVIENLTLTYNYFKTLSV